MVENSAISFANKEGFLVLKVEQVLRNEQGDNVLNDYFDSIVIKEDYIIVKKNNLFGLYNLKTLKKVLDCEWNKIVVSGRFVLAYKYSKIAVFDLEGNTILKHEWDKVVLYKKGFLVTKNDMQGFYGYNGRAILKCEWKRIIPYTNVMLAYKGEKARKIVFDYDGNVKK